MSIFKKQTYFKPFHYPQLLRYRAVIKKTPWHADEYNYDNDIQDYKTILTEHEQVVSKRAMLAIAQVEAASVKHFWGKIYDIIPKPEVAMVGYTFAENEVLHSEAYAMILDLLGFNEEFEEVLQTDVIGGRVNYLEKYLKYSGENLEQFNTLKIALFTLFVENVSLFGQFYILRSFKERKHRLQAIDNVVLATQKEELCHAQFGIELLKIIKQENPQWFDEAFYTKIQRACKKAYSAEANIIDWIFEYGDLDFITKDDVKEFLKRRFNESLQEIGCEPIFDVNTEILKASDWMYRDIYAYLRNDFFNTKSVNYSRKYITLTQIENGIDQFIQKTT